MNLETVPYTQYEEGLPQKGKAILGQKRAENIIVYQAFNDAIADYAIKNQRFGGNAYSFSRMTWIKPNFLWMMFRSGWAEKENQNRILAIEMKETGFFELLRQGVFTAYHPAAYPSENAWKNALKQSTVRIQWDPDHHPKGHQLERRAIQIGLKGQALQQFNQEFIQSIEDITSFVKEQKARLDTNSGQFLVVREAVIQVPGDLRDLLNF